MWRKRRKIRAYVEWNTKILIEILTEYGRKIY